MYWGNRRFYLIINGHALYLLKVRSSYIERYICDQWNGKMLDNLAINVKNTTNATEKL